MKPPYPLYDRSGVDDDNDLDVVIAEAVAGRSPALADGTSARWFKRKVVAIIVAVIVAAVGSLAVVLIVGAVYPVVLSPGLIAFTLGLRHAVDVDHIAAIDNVTRKLLGEGQRPLTVGLFFSWGHSTVVFVVSIVVAWTSGTFLQQVPEWANIGGYIGTLVSASVLLLFGSFNGWTAARLYWAWTSARRNQNRHGHLSTGSLGGADAGVVEGLGCLARLRCCRRIFASIDRPWKMYPVGFLFGLGFDTATEVSLLATTAILSSGSAHLPWAATLTLPVAFGCGMSLIDTLDGIFMLWAYGWATLDRELQLLFNFALTTASAAIALSIGVIQLLSAIQVAGNLSGPGWDEVTAVGDNSPVIGGCVVGFFVLSLGGAALYARCLMRRRAADNLG